jgi:hypothetical protein
MVNTLTKKQADFINRDCVIGFFKKAVNDIHGKTYFTHPRDIENINKENSRLNGQIKKFWERCDKDRNKAKEVIDWYAGKYGEWKNWSPQWCFREETVIDYENKKEKEVLCL